MRRGLARRRALLACAVVAAAGAVGGCASQGASTSSISGQTLTIYASAPSGGQADARSRDVLAAEQLAFAQSRGRAGKDQLNLVVLRGAKPSDNARTAIENKTTIAYLGEIPPGASADSLGIVGDQGILTVSPTDTAVELTQSTPAVSGSPGIYYETRGSGSRTFARVVPTTAQEAKALLADAAALHVSKVYVASDGLPYGAALAHAIAHNASAGVSVVQGAPTAAAFRASGARALIYASANRQAVGGLFDSIAAQDAAAKLMAPSALADANFAAGLSAAAQRNLQVSSPGFLPADLTATGRQFTSAFTAAYGHRPDPEAIFGYEAMSAVIGVLRNAGSHANERATVLSDFLGIRKRSSVLGTYSINSNGDTNLAPFVISHVASGRLTPYRFVSEG